MIRFENYIISETSIVNSIMNNIHEQFGGKRKLALTTYAKFHIC